MIEKGFTFIEVLVVSVLMVFIAVAVFLLQYTVGQNQLIVWKNYVNVNEANTFINNIVRELRTARAADNGAYLFNTLNDDEIIFYSDLDYDNQSERIRYSLNGNTLEKGIIEPSGFPVTYPEVNEKVTVLSENIRSEGNPIFSYYNGDWPLDTINNPLLQNQRLSETKTIKITLRLDSDDEFSQDFTLESYSQIRMLKDNL